MTYNELVVNGVTLLHRLSSNKSLDLYISGKQSTFSKPYHFGLFNRMLYGSQTEITITFDGRVFSRNLLFVYLAHIEELNTVKLSRRYEGILSISTRDVTSRANPAWVKEVPVATLKHPSVKDMLFKYEYFMRGYTDDV